MTRYISQSISQPAGSQPAGSQPARLLDIQTTSQRARQKFSQSVSQSVNQPAGQTDTQTARRRQPDSQSASQPARQTDRRTHSQPVNQPATQPVIQPMSQSVRQSFSQVLSEPVTHSASEPLSQRAKRESPVSQTTVTSHINQFKSVRRSSLNDHLNLMHYSWYGNCTDEAHRKISWLYQLPSPPTDESLNLLPRAY